MLHLHKKWCDKRSFHVFGLPLKDDSINAMVMTTVMVIGIVMVLIDVDGEDRPHVPNWQLGSSAWGFASTTPTQVVRAMGCANNANDAKYLQNLSQFSTSINAYCLKCGSLRPLEAVCSCQMRLQALCAMHYARKLCKGRGVHTFSYRDVCIVSWPRALAGGVTMIVITVHPITWPDHHPSSQAFFFCTLHCTNKYITKTWCTQIQRQ